MGLKRLNKEYKLDVNNFISLKYGSVNRDNPRIVYISGKCWISPTKEMEYERAISNVEKLFKKSVKSYMLDGVNFDDKLIIDFDVNSDKMNFGEKKFLSFDFYLRQNEKNSKPLKELKKMFTSKVKLLSNELVDCFNKNNFYVEKKK